MGTNNCIVDLHKVVASKGGGGKDKAEQIDKYKDKMVMNSKENVFPDIPKEISLESIFGMALLYPTCLSIISVDHL